MAHLYDTRWHSPLCQRVRALPHGEERSRVLLLHLQHLLLPPLPRPPVEICAPGSARDRTNPSLTPAVGDCYITTGDDP